METHNHPVDYEEGNRGTEVSKSCRSPTTASELNQRGCTEQGYQADREMLGVGGRCETERDPYQE